MVPFGSSCEGVKEKFYAEREIVLFWGQGVPEKGRVLPLFHDE
jgi:hypothetical protein